MKIIILTGRFGLGHYMAAQAIEQQLHHTLQAEIEIIDWMKYASPKYSERYYKLYTLIVDKGSKLYNKRYLRQENKKINKKPELYHYFMWQFTKFLQVKKPDVIITTLPLCAQLVSCYKEKYELKLPLITCVTDITGHSEWISKHTNLYLVGSETVKNKFIEKGVNSSIIHVTGIPVRLEFDTDIRDLEYRNFSKRRKSLLVMGGGLGILPKDDCFYEGLNSLHNMEVTIITGNNRVLYHRLHNKYQNLTVLGYVENVFDYLKKSDAIVTKPGGITVFEAIHAEVPILAWNPFLQQEIYNADFINEAKIGRIITGDSNECIDQIRSAMEDEMLRRMYQDNMRKLKKDYEGQNISLISYLSYESKPVLV
ncbi:MAG: putative UDP-N-acetylglucosamine--N-acetylmuramyl-(pentapeptide) pyrophosphoryl-undecaprenol [Herbinix sp.]|jgi:UDP-N-acetylglucosamine:LPS N-acetylglucosamine transferase|nr:putative UDP-N-acetylglucosamine--N-acetylmuramyl-(pentapeptide) pyrophosphoryl-undecaprenol [Herbinix sp.]